MLSLFLDLSDNQADSNNHVYCMDHMESHNNSDIYSSSNNKSTSSHEQQFSSQRNGSSSFFHPESPSFPLPASRNNSSTLSPFPKQSPMRRNSLSISPFIEPSPTSGSAMFTSTAMAVSSLSTPQLMSPVLPDLSHSSKYFPAMSPTSSFLASPYQSRPRTSSRSVFTFKSEGDESNHGNSWSQQEKTHHNNSNDYHYAAVLKNQRAQRVKVERTASMMNLDQEGMPKLSSPFAFHPSSLHHESRPSSSSSSSVSSSNHQYHHHHHNSNSNNNNNQQQHQQYHSLRGNSSNGFDSVSLPLNDCYSEDLNSLPTDPSPRDAISSSSASSFGSFQTGVTTPYPVVVPANVMKLSSDMSVDCDVTVIDPALLLAAEPSDLEGEPGCYMQADFNHHEQVRSPVVPNLKLESVSPSMGASSSTRAHVSSSRSSRSVTRAPQPPKSNSARASTKSSSKANKKKASSTAASASASASSSLTRKRHSCRYCEKSFFCSTGLKRHERVHTGEKPFGCETCGRHFRQRVTLKTHMRIHTGEKPLECEKCHSRFRHHATWKSHSRTCSGEPRQKGSRR